MKIKLNTDLKGYKKGDIVEISSFTDHETKKYWERRLKDAKIDKCCELIAENKKPNKKDL